MHTTKSFSSDGDRRNERALAFDELGNDCIGQAQLSLNRHFRLLMEQHQAHAQDIVGARRVDLRLCRHGRFHGQLAVVKMDLDHHHRRSLLATVLWRNVTFDGKGRWARQCHAGRFAIDKHGNAAPERDFFRPSGNNEDALRVSSIRRVTRRGRKSSLVLTAATWRWTVGTSHFFGGEFSGTVLLDGITL